MLPRPQLQLLQCQPPQMLPLPLLAPGHGARACHAPLPGLRRAAPAAAMGTLTRGTTTATGMGMAVLQQQAGQAPVPVQALQQRATCPLSDARRQRPSRRRGRRSARWRSSWPSSCGTRAWTAPSARRRCGGGTACGRARPATASSTPPARAPGATRAPPRMRRLSPLPTARAAG